MYVFAVVCCFGAMICGALQAQLSPAGVSSLGRAESDVLAAVETVRMFERLCDPPESRVYEIFTGGVAETA